MQPFGQAVEIIVFFLVHVSFGCVCVCMCVCVCVCVCLCVYYYYIYYYYNDLRDRIRFKRCKLVLGTLMQVTRK
jgi:hypothetical protein